MAGWVHQNVRPTTGGIQGAPIPGVPSNQAQLFVRYRWDVNAYGGVTLGGGVVYQDDRPLTSTTASQVIPGYERYYLNASYSLRKNLRLALSIGNLFDEDYIAATNGTLWRPGEPRNIKLTLFQSW
jgi:outer membrane receptor protein involved in Fe transport